MHQHTPFHDFEEFETAPSGGGRAKWVVGLVVFVLVLVAAAAVGYGLGRGTWTIPSSVSGHVPAALAGWLPHGGAMPPRRRTSRTTPSSSSSTKPSRAKRC
ncbi:hypothetical protein ACFQFG_01610 [Methylobacterium persicinum]